MEKTGKYKALCMSFDKLPLWYNKFTVLNTSKLPWIILFKSEIDDNTNYFNSFVHVDDI